MAAASALLELGIAPLLFWRRSRRWGIYLALSMHLIILVLIGPVFSGHLGMERRHGSVGCSFVLEFQRADAPFSSPRCDTGHRDHSLWPNADTQPVLTWDDYPSIHPFSGATMNAYMEIPQGEEPKLPRSARDVMLSDRVYFFSRSMKDTNTDGYPAERVYRGIFRQVCRQVPDLTLVIVSKPEWPSGRTTDKRESCPTLSTDSPAH